MMTLAEIDDALAFWDARLQIVDENLAALDAEPAAQRIEGSIDALPEPLEGVTKERVGPALAAMRKLFDQRQLLAEMQQRARTLRGSVSPLWPAERTLREIERTLRGPLLRLPAIDIPLARRGLLSGATAKDLITPEELLDAMKVAFEHARDVVLAMGAAWERLEPALDDAAAEVDELDRLAGVLGAEAAAELASARAQLAAMGARVAHDPLGVEQGFADAFTPLLADLRDRLLALAQEQDRIETDLARAEELLRQLRAEQSAFAAASAHYREEIADTDTAATAVTGERVAGLASWLETLDRTIEAGKWRSAGVGLGRWLTVAEADLTALQGAHTVHEAALAARAELLGRLLARREQAHALLLRGRPLDPALDELAGRAEALLRSRPTPLQEAAGLVAAYEARLRA